MAKKKATESALIREFLRAHKRPITALAFAPDGQYLASGSTDTKVRLWDVLDGDLCGEMTESPWGIVAIAVARDGRTVASVCKAIKGPNKGDTRAFLWHPIKRKTDELAFERNREIAQPAFSPTKKLVAFKHGGIRLFDVATGRQVEVMPATSGGWALAFTPDGASIVLGDTTGALHVWQSGKRKESRTLTGQSSFVTCLAFSPNGDLLASAWKRMTRRKPGRSESGTIPRVRNCRHSEANGIRQDVWRSLQII